jgi:hypothetical protein
MVNYRYKKSLVKILNLKIDIKGKTMIFHFSLERNTIPYNNYNILKSSPKKKKLKKRLTLEM